uniref:PR domain containing 1b, with ZNF domain n=1 Tax=Erpetoichthys calabaricus TaxID=27687 RepID=A0A8C4SYP0_ERPCA
MTSSSPDWENSFLFSNYKSQEARERPIENGKRSSLADSLYRFSSMPDLSSSVEKSLGYGDVGKMSAYERLSFLSSPTSSLPGTYERLKVSLPPSVPQFNRQTSMDSLREVASASPTVTPRRHHTVKYRAFPDAYQTKEKEHGKINPRPGKIYIYDQPGFTGNRTEIYSDVIDATSWVFPETISIRVVRGGWVLYEKPDFKGEKFALEEGDIELSCPFEQTEEHNPEPDDPPRKKFVIGSLRRAVRDYSVPELCLFPEENAEGKKVIFRDTSEDARIYGLPIRANSIIVNAGLWLVYAKPFFEGIPHVIEVGGYSNLKAWGAKQPDVCSVHPLKIGEPKVENINEPKVIIYEKPYFTGKCREVYTDTRDFMTRTDSQNVFMSSAGSIKVLGGCWVGYQKEGFRGHQYLLEEGDFHDWRVWGGCDSELKSLHLIRADFSDPEMVMHEYNNEDVEVQSFHVVEATPDLELLGYKSTIQSIHVLSGAWIAYSHVDYSGNQYILEKGYYHTWQDWGASDFKIASVQPILKANGDSPSFKNKIYLFSEPSFQGNCLMYDSDRACIPESFNPYSFRVVGGSWVVYEGREFSGNLYVLGEGEYPNFTTIGCAPNVIIRSVKMIPIVFSESSISIYSLECFEGKEIVLNSEIQSLLAEGFNNHVLSVRVKGGIWVACEHSNYRGSQILLEESIEITNWLKFSEMSKIGSLYPIRQKRIFFHLKNCHRGQYMTIQGDQGELKSCRVVVSEQIDGMSHVWYYQEGLLKNKLASDLSLQVVGNPEEGSKLVLWTESRIPRQSWKIQADGRICSLLFEGMTIDVKGGKTYDKDHIVMWSSSDERPTQIWDVEII